MVPSTIDLAYLSSVVAEGPPRIRELEQDLREAYQKPISHAEFQAKFNELNEVRARVDNARRALQRHRQALMHQSRVL